MRFLNLVIMTIALFCSNAFATQIDGRFLQDGSVTEVKITANAVGASRVRLENNTALRARNAADSGDVNLFKLNASDVMEFSFFPITPSSAPLSNFQVANKKYVDDSVAGISTPSWLHEFLTLNGTDITNQYKDSSQNCIVGSVMAFVTGVKGTLTADYTLSVSGGKTRISFVGSTGWGTGSSQALVSGDVIDLQCQY